MRTQLVTRRTAATAVAVAVAGLAGSPLAQASNVQGLRAPLRYIPQFTIDAAPSRLSIEVVLSPFCPDSANFVKGALLPHLKKAPSQDGSRVIFHQFARNTDDLPLMIELMSYERTKLVELSMRVMTTVYRNQRAIRRRDEIADVAKSIGARKDPSFNAGIAEAAARQMNELMIKAAGIQDTPTLYVNRRKVGLTKSEADLKSAIAKFGRA